MGKIRARAAKVKQQIQRQSTRVPRSEVLRAPKLPRDGARRPDGDWYNTVGGES